MSRVRGGNNSMELVIADQPVDAWRKGIDVLFVLGEELNFNEFRLFDFANEAGSQLYRNAVTFGYISKLLQLEKNHT